MTSSYVHVLDSDQKCSRGCASHPEGACGTRRHVAERLPAARDHPRRAGTDAGGVGRADPGARPCTRLDRGDSRSARRGPPRVTRIVDASVVAAYLLGEADDAERTALL